MKFTLSWLKNHLETDASVAEIEYALTDLGLEVEGIENPAERLADFKIGKVLSAAKHPDADKLHICQYGASMEKEYFELRQKYQESIDWRLADSWTASFFIQKEFLKL